MNKNENKKETYMPDSILPKEYNRIANSTHRLSRLDIQRAMTDIKRFVEARLESDLNLVKHAAVSALIAMSYTSYIKTFLTHIFTSQWHFKQVQESMMNLMEQNRNLPSNSLYPIKTLHEGSK